CSSPSQLEIDDSLLAGGAKYCVCEVYPIELLLVDVPAKNFVQRLVVYAERELLSEDPRLSSEHAVQLLALESLLSLRAAKEELVEAREKLEAIGDQPSSGNDAAQRDI